MDQHSKQGEGERKQVETAAESHKLQGHNCCSGHGSCGGPGHHDAPAVVKDPVCGMTVDPNAGKPRFDHNGSTYHFCSEKCLGKFKADPDHYLSGAQEKAAENSPVGTKYTCPMHPEIVRDAPGDCPICGMALEPIGVPTGEEGPNLELIDFTRRFWVGAILTMPLLVLTMGPFVGLGFIREAVGERAALWIELILGTPVILWSGWRKWKSD